MLLKEQVSPAHRKAVLSAACLAAFITPFMASAVNVALPSIGEKFSLGAVSLNWVATIYLLAAAMFLVPFGRLADIIGNRRIFARGAAVLTASTLLCSLAWDFPSLLTARFLQGIGSAMIFGTSTAMLAAAYPPEERGRVMGINVTFVYTGLSVGPFIGGLLVEQSGWRSIFLANIPLGALIVAVVLTSIREEWAGAKGERLDLAGSGLYMLTLLLVMIGLPNLTRRGGVILLALGTLAGAFFLRREGRSSSPLLNLGLFRDNPGFSFSILAALINYCATTAVSLLLALYLQSIRSLSPREAGLVLVVQPAVMAILSSPAGRLSDRVEPRLIASSGMAATAAGLFLLAPITPSTPIALIAADLALLGVGFALFSSPNVNAVMSSVRRHDYGIAASTLSTTRLVGQMLSLGLASLVFALFLGSAKIGAGNQPAFMRSILTCALLFGILCVGGVFASLARGRMRGN